MRYLLTILLCVPLFASAQVNSYSDNLGQQRYMDSVQRAMLTEMAARNKAYDAGFYVVTDTPAAGVASGLRYIDIKNVTNLTGQELAVYVMPTADMPTGYALQECRVKDATTVRVHLQGPSIPQGSYMPPFTVRITAVRP